jgi:hypothetical protein
MQIHNFMNILKIMDYEITIYILLPQIKTMANFDNFLKDFHINKYINGNYFINPRIFLPIF